LSVIEEIKYAMKKDIYNITFGGKGGQGILKASDICGWAAMFAGYHVKKSEVHGMAQRGDSVESHLRFGEKIYSPLVSLGSADFLLCFHQEEHERLKAFLKPDGIDLTDCLDKANAIIKNPKHLNTALVGMLSAYLQIKKDCWIKAIETVFNKKAIEDNVKIFLEGRDAGKS
jgi:indolepyruvate ferredoxin oxidoreductase beta subunit